MMTSETLVDTQGLSSPQERLRTLSFGSQSQVSVGNDALSGKFFVFYTILIIVWMYFEQKKINFTHLRCYFTVREDSKIFVKDKFCGIFFTKIVRS